MVRSGVSVAVSGSGALEDVSVVGVADSSACDDFRLLRPNIRGPAFLARESSAGTMTSLTPLRGRKRIGLDELSDTDLLEDELGDAVAGRDGEARRRVEVDEVDEDLAAVAGVDRAWGVDDRDPVPRRQPGARMDQPLSLIHISEPTRRS